MKHNKLVRDKIPDIILAEGHQVSTRILNDKEYKVELEKKLSDVLEVMIALAQRDGFFFFVIIVAARQKREKRGGFDKKIFLVEDK